MKLYANLRLAVTLAIFVITLLFLEGKRKQNRDRAKKTNTHSTEEYINASNTDFIFFESLSKYLFISLPQ